jgi:hypothetical protein
MYFTRNIALILATFTSGLGVALAFSNAALGGVSFDQIPEELTVCGSIKISHNTLQITPTHIIAPSSQVLKTGVLKISDLKPLSVGECVNTAKTMVYTTQGDVLFRGNLKTDVITVK